jgi:hypothetical protein
VVLVPTEYHFFNGQLVSSAVGYFDKSVTIVQVSYVFILKLVFVVGGDGGIIVT